jgi:hypothetical protein
MVSSVVGVSAFLVLLLFATQLALNLYATSVVTAAVFDGARIVAGADGGPAAHADAERHIRDLLGSYEERGALELTWDYRDTDGAPGADSVAVTVVAEHPTRLLDLVPIPFQRITRTIDVRLERLR